MKSLIFPIFFSILASTPMRAIMYPNTFDPLSPSNLVNATYCDPHPAPGCRAADGEHLIHEEEYAELLSDTYLVAHPPSLIRIADVEEIIYRILDKCSQSMMKDDDETDEKNEDQQNFEFLINDYLFAYEEAMTSDLSLVDGEEDNFKKISQNPLASFLMIHRYVKKLALLETNFGDMPEVTDLCTEYFDYIDQIEFTSLQNRDLNEGTFTDAASRILRIQHVYNFSAEDISQGRLGTIDTGIQLPIFTYFDLAVVAMDNFYYTLALEWLDLFEIKFLPSTLDDMDFLHDTKKMKLDIMEKHDETWKSSTSQLLIKGQFHFDELLMLDPSTTNLKSPRPKPRRHTWYRDPELRKVTGYEWMGNYWETNGATAWGNVIQMWALCSGDFNQTEVERSKLFCWLEKKIHPSFLIGPIKTEFLSRSPDIIRVYDVFGSPQIIKNITDDTEGKMHSSFMFGDTLDLMEALEGRNSVDARLEEEKSEVASTVSKIISRLTGLKLVDGVTESLQIIWYSFGGHCALHADMDSFTGPYQPSAQPGTRFVTVMAYLTDVRAGGLTIFNGPGIGVKPIKGSAIIWYDTKSDLSLELANVHAGCPVIYGSKLAANKWIPAGDQMFKRGCDLKSGERLKFAVNGVYS